MPNFTDDDIQLPFPKYRLRSAPEGKDNQYITSKDWNKLCTLVDATRTAVKDLDLGVPTDRSVIAGTGLTGGGDLSQNVNLALAPSGVSAGSYDAPSFTVDQFGRATTVRNDFFVSVLTSGATGDGITDDRAFIINALTSAVSLKARLHFPGGHVYRISKYIDFGGIKDLHITAGPGAIIRFPSADTSVVADSVALSNAQARSAFLLRYCQSIVIDGLTFQGDNSAAFDTENLGIGIYATHCTNVTVRCQQIDGKALFNSDSQSDTFGTGDSLTVSGSIVTLTDSSATFYPGHVGFDIRISNASDNRNNGVFRITEYVSANSVKFSNSAGVTETSSFAWSINDADKGTKLDGCWSYAARGATTVPSDSRISRCHFEQPGDDDETGIADSYAVTGTTVTLTDASRRFRPNMVGKYIKTSGSTSSVANDGVFQITAFISSSQIQYVNASAVAETCPATSFYWIMGGDKTGLGAGLSKSGTTMTLTVATNSFSSADVNKAIRVRGAAATNNNGVFRITAVLAANQVTFENSSGATDLSYTGMWGVDSYDAIGPSGAAYGSIHAIYLFAGRKNVEIEGCTFKNIRKTAVKVSGTTSAVRGIRIINNYAEKCGSFAVVGADDSQEHSDITISGNVLIDCGTGRQGWSDSYAMQLLGGRGYKVQNNSFHYTRNAISAVDGRASIAGVYGIQASRYLAGISQPVEDLTIADNVFTFDGTSAQTNNLLVAAISAIRVGQTAYYRTGGSLTKSGSTITLNDSQASFSQDLVGRSIRIVNCTTAGNNGTFTVLTVPTSSTLTYTNASGVAEACGTYGVYGRSGKQSAGCIIARNQILGPSATGIESQFNVGPEIVDNILNNAQINETGSVTPRVARNREVGSTTSSVRLRLNSGTSWPIVHDNTITNNALSSNVSARDIGIGVNNGTAVDYPLLGVKGRCRATQALQQIVVPYGSEFVDGDTIEVTGTVYTYKASSPTGNQFNSFAGLIALIDAQANHDCADYGTGFAAGSVTTQHMLISRTTQTTADTGQIYVTVKAMNPTTLPFLPNRTASNLPYTHGRGSGSAGPIPDKIVIWSPLCAWTAVEHVIPDNVDARTILQVNGPALPIKDSQDGGADSVVLVGDCTGKTPEFRWSLR